MHGGVGRGKVPCRIGPLKHGMLPSRRPKRGSSGANAVPSDDLVSSLLKRRNPTRSPNSDRQRRAAQLAKQQLDRAATSASKSTGRFE